MDIYTFKAQYKPVIWGGDRIARFKDVVIDADNIGESWELSSVPGSVSVVADGCADAGSSITDLIGKYGAKLLGTKVYRAGDTTFPLLIKFIDARRDLSVQVHPDDALAAERHNSPGKTEMWYILDSDIGARIHCGLSAPLTRQGYRQCIADDSIMDFVASYPSMPGQFYFVPAGTIHAIGGGNLVAEIQQTSDITYRVYDYNRRGTDGKPRQLHTELACDAIDYTYPKEIEPMARVVTDTEAAVVKSDYFTVDFVRLADGATHPVDHNGESFRILMVTDGAMTVESEGGTRTYRRGTTALIPAHYRHFVLNGSGAALLIGC